MKNIGDYEIVAMLDAAAPMALSGLLGTDPGPRRKCHSIEPEEETSGRTAAFAAGFDSRAEMS